MSTLEIGKSISMKNMIKGQNLILLTAKKTTVVFGYNSNNSEIDCLVFPIINYQKIDEKRTFTYENKVANQDEWGNIQFTFKNNEKTAIKELYFT